MKDSRNVFRRHWVIAAIGSLLLVGQPRVWSLSRPGRPPTLEDHVREADLIVVGRIEEFTFRGYIRSTLPQEYNKDFPQDNGLGNRVLDVFVRVDRVLKNIAVVTPPPRMRIARPFARDTQGEHLGKVEIFLVGKGRLLDGGDPGSRVYNPVIHALPIDQEDAVRQLVALTRGAKDK